VKSIQLIETDGKYTLSFENLEVTLLQIGFQFTLNFWENDNYFVVINIESPFKFLSGGNTLEINPEECPPAIAPALVVLHQKLESLTIMKPGLLNIVFSNQMMISVPPDQMYEAWSVSGPNGLQVICTPGGGLYITP
jgi:hypothetical protein